MTIYGYVLPGTVSLTNWPLTGQTTFQRKSNKKLKVLDWLKHHNNNISLTARYFGLTRNTIFYKSKNVGHLSGSGYSFFLFLIIFI